MKTKSILSVLMAFLMLSSIASAVEIRGTVINETNLVPGYVWSAQEFAGFYYDLDKGESFETLTIEDVETRTIPANHLIYKTDKIEVNFSYSDDKKKNVYESVHSYYLVGWQAEKWVAVNGKSNKLVKLITELKGSEKVSVSGGGVLTLGNGYSMKINAVDANSAPRQAWVQIIKNGNVVDDAVLQQGEVYNLQKDVGGESDVLVLSAYVSSIFYGAESQMLQLQYVWLIDESSLIEIKSGDSYGVFEVTSTTPLKLENDASLTLSKDSEIDIMGNMKFKVADSDTLRFYPYVKISDNMSVSTSSGTTSSGTGQTIYIDRWNNQTGTMVNGTFVSNVPCIPTIVEKIVEKEKIVYVTATPTEAPAVVATTKKDNVIPGFEAIFAIAGLIVVAFVVLRQRRKD